MNAYAYSAALWCTDCTEKLKADLAATASDFEFRKDSEDSNDWPQGPHPNGGGEADTPQHCDHCGVFLGNLLTSDGEAYLREKANSYMSPDDGDVAPWALVADRAEDDGQSTLAEWIRFYFAPGM